MAMDLIGFALGTYQNPARIEWCIGKKGGEMPLHKDNTLLNGSGSFNSIFMIFLLRTLIDVNQTDMFDVPPYKIYLKNKLKHSIEFKSDRMIVPNRLYREKSDDNGLIFPISCAIGYYCAANRLDQFFMSVLFEYIISLFEISNDERDAANLLTHTIYRLIKNGYFCGEHIDEMVDHAVVPNSMVWYLEYLSENNFNEDFLLAGFDSDLVKNLTYSQQVIAETYFYMLRISTGYTWQLKGLPRDQFTAIYTSDISKPEDSGFVFGAVCTASEQCHPVRENVRGTRSNVRYQSVVRDLLRFS